MSLKLSVQLSKAIKLPLNRGISLTSYRQFASVDGKAANAWGRAVSGAEKYAHGPIRNNWSREEVQEIFDSPIMELLYHGVS
jgi:biotin synthase